MFCVEGWARLVLWKVVVVSTCWTHTGQVRSMSFNHYSLMKPLPSAVCHLDPFHMALAELDVHHTWNCLCNFEIYMNNYCGNHDNLNHLLICHLHYKWFLMLVKSKSLFLISKMFLKSGRFVVLVTADILKLVYGAFWFNTVTKDFKDITILLILNDTNMLLWIFEQLLYTYISDIWRIWKPLRWGLLQEIK